MTLRIFVDVLRVWLSNALSKDPFSCKILLLFVSSTRIFVLIVSLVSKPFCRTLNILDIDLLFLLSSTRRTTGGSSYFSVSPNSFTIFVEPIYFLFCTLLFLTRLRTVLKSSSSCSPTLRRFRVSSISTTAL